MIINNQIKDHFVFAAAAGVGVPGAGLLYDYIFIAT
jgi:hypothetical protein